MAAAISKKPVFWAIFIGLIFLVSLTAVPFYINGVVNLYVVFSIFMWFVYSVLIFVFSYRFIFQKIGVNFLVFGFSYILLYSIFIFWNVASLLLESS